MTTAKSAKLRPLLDQLEVRQMLSASPVAPAFPAHPSGLSLANLQQYYGINTPQAGATAQSQEDGKGQTIVVMSYSRDGSFVGTDSPNWVGSGLDLYSRAMGLPGRGDFTFTMVNEDGVDAAQDPSVLIPASTQRAAEFDLDIEAVHLMAPYANIVDVVISRSGDKTYAKALATALASRPGSTPAAITSSYSGTESHTASTAGYVDGNGITYVQSAGDSGGGEQYDYPHGVTNRHQKGYKPMNAINALTVMVGGTSLTAHADGTFTDVAWGQGQHTYMSRVKNAANHYVYSFQKRGGTGGGYSLYTPRPDYQVESPAVIANETLFPAKARGKRLGPDVSMVSVPGIEVLGFDPTVNKMVWSGEGGTSLAAPLFAGVMGVVDQRRALAGLPSLSSTDTLHFLYQAPESDFNDITSGSNGYKTLPGFDLASGRGAVQAGLIGYLTSAAYPTEIAITSAVANSATHQTTLKAHVTADHTVKVPVGAVIFTVDGQSVGTATVDDQGNATLTVATAKLRSQAPAAQFFSTTAAGVNRDLYAGSSTGNAS